MVGSGAGDMALLFGKVLELPMDFRGMTGGFSTRDPIFLLRPKILGISFNLSGDGDPSLDFYFPTILVTSLSISLSCNCFVCLNSSFYKCSNDSYCCIMREPPLSKSSCSPDLSWSSCSLTIVRALPDKIYLNSSWL